MNIQFNRTVIKEYIEHQEKCLANGESLFFTINRLDKFECFTCKLTVNIQFGIMIDYDPADHDVDELDFDANCGLYFFCNDACANTFIMTYEVK